MLQDKTQALTVESQFKIKRSKILKNKSYSKQENGTVYHEGADAGFHIVV